MTQLDTPKVVKKKLFSPIWLLPLVALALGAWLGVKSIRESGIEIQIHFPNATGIDVGKTLVKYQGLTVGKVTDISIDDDLHGVDVKVVMDYRSGPFLNENTLFWLVTPKASITGVEGLDALFSGNYIAIQPGDGDSETRFEANREAPPMLPGNEGMLVELSSDKLGSLDVGSPVFYRQIPVGSVISYRLEGNTRVLISAFIQEQYAHLVKKDSQFWNVSGVKIDASLAGVKVNTESLASILAGGISFSSTENQASAKNGDTFPLFETEALAKGGITFELTVDNGDGVSAGTAISYRGVTIGEVTSKTLTANGVLLKAKINALNSALLTESARFWLEGANISLSGITHPERLITGAVINFMPGKGDPKTRYPLESQAPELISAKKLTVNISSDTNFGVSTGAHVKYKNFPIGTVTQVNLSKDFKQVEYKAEILPEFSTLVTSSSYFVPESALAIEASLDGVSVKTADMGTLVEGAISLISDTSSVTNDPSTQDNLKAVSLTLYASIDAARSAAEKRNVQYLTLSSRAGADVAQGSPVYYKKMQIGQIDAVTWSANSEDFAIKVGIKKPFAALLKPNTVFWRNSAVEVNASLAGIDVAIAPLQGALKGSISLGLLDDNKQGSQTRLYETKELALAQASPISLQFPAEVRLASKAAIRYQGHQIGVVEQVRLNADLKTVTASAYLYGDYAHYFTRQDTQFFIVDASVSLAGIKAPETLLTGPYISAIPGSSASQSSVFTGALSVKDYADIPQDALRLTLTKANLGSLSIGTKIFYRGIAIGQVDGYRLSDDGTQVNIQTHISKTYAHLVNQSSQFWDLSGVKLDVGLFSGAKVETGSLETILAGGIGVVTQDSTTAANQLNNGNTFTLHSQMDDSWSKWAPAQ